MTAFLWIAGTALAVGVVAGAVAYIGDVLTCWIVQKHIEENDDGGSCEE